MMRRELRREGGTGNEPTRFAAATPDRGGNLSGLGSTDDDVRPHPGMDAALVVVNARLLDVRVRLAPGRDELNLVVGRRIALGRGHRIAGQLIEKVDESAAELMHLGERVHLAALVSGLQCLAVAQVYDARRAMPRAGLLRLGDLRDEGVERHAAAVART